MAVGAVVASTASLADDRGDDVAVPTDVVATSVLDEHVRLENAARTSRDAVREGVPGELLATDVTAGPAVSAVEAREAARAAARAERRERAREKRQRRREAAERARERRERALRAARRASARHVPPGTNRDLGLRMARARGWGGRQWDCLDRLWSAESGWSTSATNGSSGAYGIPQALPGSKMARHGADWRTSARTQIAWGLSYIGSRWGTPCGAYAHFRARNWY